MTVQYHCLCGKELPVSTRCAFFAAAPSPLIFCIKSSTGAWSITSFSRRRIVHNLLLLCSIASSLREQGDNTAQRPEIFQKYLIFNSTSNNFQVAILVFLRKAFARLNSYETFRATFKHCAAEILLGNQRITLSCPLGYRRIDSKIAMRVDFRLQKTKRKKFFVHFLLFCSAHVLKIKRIEEEAVA